MDGFQVTTQVADGAECLPAEATPRQAHVLLLVVEQRHRVPVSLQTYTALERGPV